MCPPFGMNSISFISSSDGMPLLIRCRSCRTCAPRSVASSRSWWVKNCDARDLQERVLDHPEVRLHHRRRAVDGAVEVPVAQAQLVLHPLDGLGRQRAVAVVPLGALGTRRRRRG